MQLAPNLGFNPLWVGGLQELHGVHMSSPLPLEKVQHQFVMHRPSGLQMYGPGVVQVAHIGPFPPAFVQHQAVLGLGQGVFVAQPQTVDLLVGLQLRPNMYGSSSGSSGGSDQSLPVVSRPASYTGGGGLRHVVRSKSVIVKSDGVVRSMTQRWFSDGTEDIVKD